MNRNVEINIPMFIGIILIIIVITAGLVWGVRAIRGLRDENNNKIDSGIQGLEDFFNIDKTDNNDISSNSNIENINQNIE